jgi:GTP-binding protein HflX
VTDAGASREAQMQSVRGFSEIGAHTKPGLSFNKIDTTDADSLASLHRRYPNAAFVAALTGEGVDGLVARIAEEAARGSVTVTALIPYTRGELVRLAHERTQILSERHTEKGTLLVMRVPSELTPPFEEYRAESRASSAD